MDARLRPTVVSAAAVLYLLFWPNAGITLETRLIAYSLIGLSLGYRLLIPQRRFHAIFVDWSATLPQEKANERRERLLYGLAVLLTIAGYYVLHKIDPIYFNQDDNFSQFGPVILAGVEGFLRDGTFPNWNPFQLMGAPTADVGVYALTYPPTYLAVVAAKALGNRELWADVFFLLHAFPGVLLTVYCFRAARMSRTLALSAAMSFLFCGYNIGAGRSWYYMIPLLVTIPTLGWLLVRIEQMRSRRWFWVSALTLGLSFHAGNTQMWFYWGMFWVTGVAWNYVYRKTIPIRSEILRFGSIALVALGIAFPLLLVQLMFMATVKRDPQGHGTIAEHLGEIIFPIPLFRTTNSGIYPEFGHVFYGGTVFPILALLVVSYSYLHWLGKRRTPWDYTISCGVVIASIAFVLGMGRLGILWSLLEAGPPFSLFSHPFKFLPYILFFSCLTGGLFLERIARRLSKQEGRTLRASVMVLVLGLTSLHLSASDQAFYVFGDRSYTPLAEGLERKIRGDRNYTRIESVAALRDNRPGYKNSLTHNFATAHGIAAVWGYDPLVRNTLINRQWWEKWNEALCVDAFDINSKIGCNPARPHRPQLLENLLRVSGSHFRLIYQRHQERPTLVPVSDPDPIAFDFHNRTHALPFVVNFSGVSVVNEGNSVGPVLINFLRRPRMQATVDGTRIDVQEDAWGRVILQPPPGWKNISLRYVPAWSWGLLIGLGLTLSGLVIYRRGSPT